ncbi:MAG: DUF4272 domain-containing protein [Myxococcota bacterium]
MSDASINGGIATQYEIRVYHDKVIFYVMPEADMQRHLAGFSRYVGSLGDDERRVADARKLIGKTTGVLGMVTDVTFDDNPGIWELIFAVIGAFDGFVFTFDSLVLANRTVLVGPLRLDPTVPEESLHGVVRTNADSPNPTAAQLARKARSTAKVRALGLPTLDSLPVVEDDAAIAPRSVDEVAARCLATAICAVRGETNDAKIADALVARFGIAGALSPKEVAFLKSAGTPRALIDFAWGYEHVHVFLWALGYLPALNAPNKIADVAREMSLIREKGPAAFAKDAHLRPVAELLDANDLYYRLHWAAIELRIDGYENAAVDEGIVMERHRALNWLIRYMNRAWDDVTADT